MSDSHSLDGMFSRARAMGVPFSGSFELTSRCNLDCKMCYIHNRANDATAMRRELSAQKWISIAESAVKEGMILLLLTGGEPFVYKDFFEVYGACKEMGTVVSINSNGTSLTDSIIGKLCNDRPSRINISLYGASPETYEKLCGDGNMYYKTVDTIKKLCECGINVRLSYCLNNYNSGDMAEIYRFAGEKKIGIQTSSYMFPPLRACENGNCTATRPDGKTAGELGACALLERHVRDDFLSKVELIEAQGLINDEINSCIEKNGEQVICRAGRCTFWITYDGRMLPCGMMHEPSVNMKDESFSQAWSRIKAETEKIVLPKECAKCKIRYACEMCAASCYAETGSFDKVPKYQCEKTKAFISTLDCLKKQFGE